MTTATATATPTATTEPRFLVRFDRIWEALRRYQVREGLCWTFMVTVLALGVLSLADYWFELPLTARGIGLDVVGVLALVVLWYAVVVPLRWWSRPRTAAELESRFPQLGQRIRTVVQFARLPDERIHSEGVAPSLVAALAEDTQVHARALPLDVIIPRRRVRAVAALAVVPMLAILAPALVNPEWRTTLARLLLIEQPYTTIAVAPGDVTVDQGNNLPISVELKGRKRSRVVLETRPAEASKEPWLSRPLAPSTSGPATHRTATLEKLRKPLVYRVVAGPAASRTSRITIRYPLALTTFKVTLAPPAYTGLPQETVQGGDLRAVAGTEATFRMVFNALPLEASLVVSEPKASTKNQEGSALPPAPQVIPLVSDGKAFTARLSIARDVEYTIVARTDDGRKLPRNGYHIDARADYPPRVGFDEPEEALEVHPIAEVLNRIRVGDDFGLSKAGIVYRVNDGEEKTLVARDFTAQSAKPQTASKLEEMLALETLALTPTDSVTYYAFAEDNFPGGSRRVETDLRYIDIRPFKRTYKLADGAGDEDPGESTTLTELIARQRFNLNRTVRLAKHLPGDRTTPEDPLKITTFEELLAALTREVVEAFQRVAPDQFESLQQAEAAMVAAVNALDREKNDDAAALEAEALRHLIEARRTFRFLVGNGDTSQAMMQKLRAFDRTQAQKIRKPKNEADAAEALVAEIEELAGDEDFVYATIAQISDGSTPLPVETVPVQEPNPAEGPPPTTDEPAPNTGQAQAGQTGQEGQDTAKEGDPKQTGPMAARGKSGTGKAVGTGKQAANKEGEDPSSTPPKKAQRGLPKAERPGEQPAKDGPDSPKQGSKKQSGRMADRGEPDTQKTGRQSDEGPGEDPSETPATKGAARQAGTQKGNDQSGPDGQVEAKKGGSPKNGRMADRGNSGKEKGNDQPGPDGHDEAKKGGSPKNGRMADRGDSGKENGKAQPGPDSRTDRANASGQPKKKKSAAPGAMSDAGTAEGGKSKLMDHRAITAEQGRITDEARDLEERLKRLEPASELSKLRMAKAAEAAERAAGALERGQSKEAAGLTKNGAMLLHEVASQVKGEIAREPADAVAMARDRAEELAQREAEFAEMPPTASASESESPGSESARSKKGSKAGARGKETDAEMLERLAEEARTLEQWLKQIAGRGEGKAGELARELLDQGKMTEIIRQIDRIAEMHQAGKSDEARGEAAKVAQALEALARSLDMLHRDIVAPRLAELVEAEKRLADLSERLDSLKTDAEVNAWHRQTVAMVRDLEKKEAMTEVVAELEKAMVDAGWTAAGGIWTWNTPNGNWRAPVTYKDSLKKIARRLQDQIQDMILKDMMSSRDETTPPEFKELVERYYEVLSREGGGESRRPR